MISERHERLILEEYAVAGLAPAYRSDGELVTLGLARWINARKARAKPLDHPTDAYQGAGE
jgi:hypothetical protein